MSRPIDASRSIACYLAHLSQLKRDFLRGTIDSILVIMFNKMGSRRRDNHVMAAHHDVCICETTDASFRKSAPRNYWSIGIAYQACRVLKPSTGVPASVTCLPTLKKKRLLVLIPSYIIFMRDMAAWLKELIMQQYNVQGHLNILHRGVSLLPIKIWCISSRIKTFFQTR